MQQGIVRTLCLQNHQSWEPVLKSIRNQSVVRQPTAFISERPKSSQARFVSQVDEKRVLINPFSSQLKSNDQLVNTQFKSLARKPNGRIVIAYVGNSQSTRVRNVYEPVMPLRHRQRRAENKITLKWVPTGRIFMMDGIKWSYVCKPTSNNKNDKEFPNGLNDHFKNPCKCTPSSHKSTVLYKIDNSSSGLVTKKTQVWRPKALKSPNVGDQISHQ